MPGHALSLYPEHFLKLNWPPGTASQSCLSLYHACASYFFLFFYLFLAVLGLPCCAQVSLVAASGGLVSSCGVHGLLIAMAAVVAKHRL